MSNKGLTLILISIIVITSNTDGDDTPEVHVTTHHECLSTCSDRYLQSLSNLYREVYQLRVNMENVRDTLTEESLNIQVLITDGQGESNNKHNLVLKRIEKSKRRLLKEIRNCPRDK